MRIFEPILGEKANSLRESVLPLASRPICSCQLCSVGRAYESHTNRNAQCGWPDEVCGQNGDMYGV